MSAVGQALDPQVHRCAREREREFREFEEMASDYNSDFLGSLTHSARVGTSPFVDLGVVEGSNAKCVAGRQASIELSENSRLLA